MADDFESLRPLGYQRMRLLSCLSGFRAQPPTLLPGEDAFAAFRRFVQHATERLGADNDPRVVSLLAAARLLSGELNAADVLLDNLPLRPFARDHGAGYCLLAAVAALQSALPLPSALREATLLANSPAQQSTRAWLSARRDDLRWQEAAGVYALQSAP